MNHSIKLKPFNVPSFAIQEIPAGSRQEGFTQAPSYPLSDLGADTLDALCAEFRSSVFAKAGKMDPKSGIGLVSSKGHSQAHTEDR